MDIQSSSSFLLRISVWNTHYFGKKQETFAEILPSIGGAWWNPLCCGRPWRTRRRAALWTFLRRVVFAIAVVQQTQISAGVSISREKKCTSCDTREIFTWGYAYSITAATISCSDLILVVFSFTGDEKCQLKKRMCIFSSPAAGKFDPPSSS